MFYELHEFRQTVLKFVYECGKEAYRDGHPLDLAENLGYEDSQFIDEWKRGWKYEQEKETCQSETN